MPRWYQIYDAADTALFGDMRSSVKKGSTLQFAHWRLLHHGAGRCCAAVKLLKPRFVMPIHYNTFPPITQDAGAWAVGAERNRHAAGRSRAR